MKHRYPDKVIGIAWFAREDYEAFRRLLPRRDWHATYDQWEQDASHLLDLQRREGLHALKVPVRSDTYAEWCWTTGQEPHSSLSAYVSERVFDLAAAQERRKLK